MFLLHPPQDTDSALNQENVSGLGRLKEPGAVKKILDQTWICASEVYMKEINFYCCYVTLILDFSIFHSQIRRNTGKKGPGYKYTCKSEKITPVITYLLKNYVVT